MKSEVIIIGGGIIGITLASILAKSGISTILIEKQNLSQLKNTRSDGRASAITYRSKLFLEKHGFWQILEKYSSPINHIKIIDKDSSYPVNFTNDLIGNKALGYMIENYHIINSLHDNTANIPNLIIVEEESIKSITSDQYKISIQTDRAEYSASLLIGADGKFSNVRKLAHIKSSTCKFNQTAIVCNVSHELDHQNIAYEKFFPQGPFAILPLAGGKSSSIVWIEPQELANIYLNMNKDELNDYLSLKFGNHLGKVEIISKIFSHNLTSSKALKYYDTRLALIGDAAHSIHPLAGQGLNLGIMDIEALINAIQEAKTYGLDIGSELLLEKYQNMRMSDNENMLCITTLLNNLFSNNIYSVSKIRKLGLNIVESLPIAKKFFMKYAMGFR